jgi:hypothetical protein
MADVRVTSTITTYQNRVSEKSYVLSMKYGSATQGAKGVRNKLFISFLFCVYDVGVQFL